MEGTASSKKERDTSTQSGWGAFASFRQVRDRHGDTSRSFSLDILFFVLLVFSIVGYYTYTQVLGSTIFNRTVVTTLDTERGLVGHWTFDGSDMDWSSSTAEVIDRSGNSRRGNSINATNRQVTLGQIGQAFRFDGVDDHVLTNEVDAFQFPDAEFTVTGWFNTASSANIYIATQDGCSGGWRVRLLSGELTASLLASGNCGGTAANRASATTLNDGSWHHFAVVFTTDTTVSSNNTISIYIDGVLNQGSVSRNGSPYAVSSDRFQISGLSEGSNRAFDGALDDIRIYNRALTLAEVQAVYSLGEGTEMAVTQTPTNLETGLVGHWTFDGPDTTTATATDVSGGGNDGTLTGGPTKVIGKLGQAVMLDGVDDRVVTAGAATDYQFPNSTFTVTGWFKKTDTSNGYIVTQGACSGGWGVLMLSGTLRFRLKSAGQCGGDAAARSSSLTTLNDGSWHHFAAVVTTDTTTSGNNDITIYIDGVLNQGSVSRNGSSYGTTSSELIVGVSIGAGSYLAGGVDDVRIYNRTLSAEEVAQLYALGGGSTVKICREDSVQDADANTYNTIAIGSQCWLDRNMNVGTRIDVASNQTDNSTTEKYCYSDTDSNCTGNHPNKPDGGLYQWNEAMQYSTIEGAQGICPAGFHIPTDAEWHILEKFFADSGQSCDGQRSSSYSCSPAGTKLYAGGSSMFEANLGGLINAGSSVNRNIVGYFWSSTESGASAYLRDLTGISTIRRVASTKSYGISVRCVQD